MTKGVRALSLTASAALTIAFAGTVGAAAWLIVRGTPVTPAITIALSGGAALACMLALGSGEQLERLQQRLARRPGQILPIMASIWALYFLYTVGTRTVRDGALIGMAVYVALPFILLRRVRGATRGTWQDAIAILWTWLPIEMGLMRWLLLRGSPDTDFQYPFVQGLAVTTGILAFAAWRRLPGIGYRFRIDRRSLVLAMLSFGAFAAIAIPLGTSIHFIQYSFEPGKLITAPAVFAGVFVFTAIPEEFLFRGLIQNCLERTRLGRVAGLVVASILFGASHLNNGLSIPNYRYCVMATIAGLFYGLTWQRTGNVTASATAHALVNTAWSVFFR